MIRVSLRSALFVTIVAIGITQATIASAASISRDLTCDVAADSALGVEDYAEAIRLHERIIAIRPGDGLAHYHLGFAYGMTDQRDRELSEYRKAAALGLRQWDLYVNLGRVYLERGDYSSAVDALQNAVALGPSHSEAHFNLGLAYERQRMLPQAEAETRTALRLGAEPTEAANMLAIIYAEEGRSVEARRIWTDLVQTAPGSKVARTNLAILDRLDHRVASAPVAAPASLTFAQAKP